jgi:hypothetical protein
VKDSHKLKPKGKTFAWQQDQFNFVLNILSDSDLLLSPPNLGKLEFIGPLVLACNAQPCFARERAIDRSVLHKHLQNRKSFLESCAKMKARMRAQYQEAAAAFKGPSNLNIWQKALDRDAASCVP